MLCKTYEMAVVLTIMTNTYIYLYICIIYACTCITDVI